MDHYENFPVASFLVPARLRPAVVAVYRFARAADDLADEGEATAGARLAALETFGRALDAIERGETPSLAPFPELAAAIRRHALPIDPLRDLLSAFSQDVTTTRYADATTLLDYCERSANPVGRVMLALYGAATPANLRASDAICTGLQLTNFWQDVAIDWAKGRVYLPQDDLARFGVAEGQIASGRIEGGWSALMAFETARARAARRRAPVARGAPPAPAPRDRGRHRRRSARPRPDRPRAGGRVPATPRPRAGRLGRRRLARRLPASAGACMSAPRRPQRESPRSASARRVVQ